MWHKAKQKCRVSFTYGTNFRVGLTDQLSSYKTSTLTPLAPRKTFFFIFGVRHTKWYTNYSWLDSQGFLLAGLGEPYVVLEDGTQIGQMQESSLPIVLSLWPTPREILNIGH